MQVSPLPCPPELFSRDTYSGPRFGGLLSHDHDSARSRLKYILELGGLIIKATLAVYAEYVFKSLSSKHLKKPTECTLLGHISWIRQMMEREIAHSIQWCDTRDMTADGRTKGGIDREMLLQVMGGTQSFKHDLKHHALYRASQASRSAVA
eukprot:1983357-Pyramimonas_sp.AAC.1